MIDNAVFIGFIAPGDEVARRDFTRVAQNHRDEFTFGIVSDNELIDETGVKSPTIICYRPQDRESNALPSFADADELDKLVLSFSRPHISELMPYNYQRLLDVSLHDPTLSRLAQDLTGIGSVPGP